MSIELSGTAEICGKEPCMLRCLAWTKVVLSATRPRGPATRQIVILGDKSMFSFTLKLGESGVVDGLGTSICSAVAPWMVPPSWF